MSMASLIYLESVPELLGHILGDKSTAGLSILLRLLDFSAALANAIIPVRL